MKKLLLLAPLLVLCWNLTGQSCTADWTFDDTDLTIQFTDLSTSAPNDPIISWTWDFDDGTTSNQQHPLHTFPAPDKYNVELAIWTQSGCTDTLKIPIEICEFSISVGQGSCDANGNIPLTITVYDLYDNAKKVNIYVDGNLVPGSPFDIDQANPVTLNYDVPGDGLSHTVLVQSTHISTCNEEVSFTVDDCGASCFLSAIDVNFTGGVTHTVIVGLNGNNVFSPATTTIVIGDVVHFTWDDGGHSSTSDATSGPDSWNSGVQNVGYTYDVTINNPGVHGYYCIPHGGPGGVGMSGTIVANCPAGNNIQIEITFNTTQANPGGYNVLIDGVVQPGSPHAYQGTGQQTVTATISGDGQLHEVKIQDVDVPTCEVSTNILAPDCGAAPTCQLTVTAVENGPCNANDQVPVDVTVTAINPGNQGFNVKIDGVLSPGSPYTYNASGPTTVTVDVTGDGQSHTILVEDVQDPTCNASTSLTTTNCTIPCSLTNLTASTGSSQTHVVLIKDNFFEPQHITITSGDVVEWQWVGAISHSSTSDATSGPDSWNSTVLTPGSTFTSPVLSAGVHPYYCIPHGGPGGAGMSGTVTVQANCTNGMVQVAITFDEQGGGFNGYRVLVDGVPVDTFAYDPSGNNSATVLVTGDGQSHTIKVEDLDDPNCAATTSIVTPNCNAPPCQLTVTAVENGPCNANDEVPVDVTVTVVGAGNQGFNVKIDGVLSPGSPYTYNASGPTTVTVDLAGDGQSHTILVEDVQDPTCNASTSLTTTNCTIPCTLTNLTASTGSSQTHVVEVKDFEFVPKHITIAAGDVVEWQWTGAVQHTSTSDAASGPDSWNSGLLGSGATFTSPVLSTGLHPYYCIPHGGPGGFGMSGTVTVLANCDSGLVQVNVAFDAAGGSFNGFKLLVDSVIVDTLNYDTSGNNNLSVLVAGDGNAHTITIQDMDDSTCVTSTTVITPNCNAGPVCELNLTGSTGSCDSTQMVEVALSLEAINPGNEFYLFIDSTAWSGNPLAYDSSGTTTVTLPLDGDGENHLFIVQDGADSTCTDTLNLSLPACNLPCALSNLQLEPAGNGNPATHIVEVKDFEFVPKDLQVAVGDTVRWVWTGQIAHTTTSDATSGPLFWNSGLQSTGATFDLVVTEEGMHPYYCIPHGGPGGVGMSGTIVATAPCDSGLVLVQVSFEAQNGSAGGYEVKVDGSPLAGGPFPYHPSGNNQLSLELPGDGQNHQVTIADSQDSACMISSGILVPECGGGGPALCELSVAAQLNGDCDSTGQVAILLDVSHQNAGSAFNVLIDGVLYPGSPFAYDSAGTTQLTLVLTGNGETRTISVEDADSLSCTAQTQLLVPQCGPLCVIEDLSVQGAGQKHVIYVTDYEFVPKVVNALVGDTIEFVWTGQVPHTSTSDALSGPDSWDSGLLGQGSIFQVVPSKAGLHPYYCQVHGGPNGIGMSGVIRVTDTCNNGTASLSALFSVISGSPLGYRVFIDGQEVPGGPFAYQNATGENSIVFAMPGDSLQHQLTIQDVEVNYCAKTLIFQAPWCPVPCMIKNVEVSQGSEIIHEIEVTDFEFIPSQLTVRTGETVRFRWTGAIPHSTTSDATTGPDVWNSGVHAAGFEFEVVLTTPGTHPYFCIPHGGPGGAGMSGSITAIDACEEDSVQVQVHFDAAGTGTGGYNVYVDGVMHPASPFMYDDPAGSNQLMLNLPGDGTVHLITLQDADSSQCTQTVEVEVPLCSDECAITNLDIDFPQPKKHTVLVKDFEFEPKELTMELGDTVHFEWVGQVAHTSTSDASSGPDAWNSELLSAGAFFEVVPNTAGEHPYYCIPHGGPGGMGMSGKLIVEDTGCDDGQVSATVSFENMNTGNQFEIYLDDELVPGGPFAYSGTGYNEFGLDLAGDGAGHNLVIADAENGLCADTVFFEAPFCSGDCSLSMNLQQTGDCDENLQVPYLLTATGNNTGTQFRVWLDGEEVAGSPFTYDSSGTSAVPLLLPGDGALHLLEIADADSLSCLASQTLTTPLCNLACQVSATLIPSGPCDVEGNQTFDLVVAGANTGDHFNVFLNGTALPAGPFEYSGDTTILSLALPGNGFFHQVVVTDLANTGCSDTLYVQTTNCSEACSIGNISIDVDVPLVHTVEVRDFEFLPKEITVSTGDTIRFVWTGQVPHTTTSDATTGPVVWNSGLLGQGSVYDLVITQTGTHSYYCIPHGGPGGIGMSGVIHAEAPCDDGELNLRLRFEGTNTGPAGYHVIAGGELVSGSPFAYQPAGNNELVFGLPANGLSTPLTIVDALDSTCAASTTVLMPDCLDPCYGFIADWQVETYPANLTASFTNTSQVTGAQFHWDFGDGSSSSEENPVHIFPDTGTYQVCLVIESPANFCADTLCRTVEFNLDVCEASFSLEQEGLTVSLTNTSLAGDQLSSLLWNLGNGVLMSDEEQVQFTYDSLGIYTICLSISTGQCQDDTCVVLDLTEPCLVFVPDFAFTVNQSNLSVQFIDLSEGGANQWLWGFGDGNTSNDQNPLHYYDAPGEYTVCLLAQNTGLGCNASLCTTIQIGLTATTEETRRNLSLQVFPNPVPQRRPAFTLEGLLDRHLGKTLSLEMYDMHGKTILTKKVDGQKRLNLHLPALLPAGVYFAELRSEDNYVYRAKVLVE
ncbi:MAG: hypothetical protein Kow0027_04150 [Saprospiraceae bacterium]